MSTATEATVAPVGQDTSALTHIVNCPDDKDNTEAWITEARVFGLELTALCGHRWVPTRDPIRHPTCPECVDAANIIIAEVGA
ncbi:DUF3039 domain-containing protein [Curtobacterium sp. MCBA15_004]|uniref:DUF3039 domain-containing protein n=1 Tax=Curtobacterium sp. MCBA15_004 TaxID=1898733 RepID=UPI0008DC76EB|nr:DUF3039 domain-containing protein [Curtobacterium sp. MCBA15_004]WIA95837.1 DUF3039 domain-containing protein [Curtobacterium sp. MCBA15_004]